ncbi:flagellar hook assembly protein FlgD [Belnapia sp. T6]|uniref:Basal-body rod modification protein FlgD n=1 Tax=Belnapia mucosa TaxID=2804532 RepID=A0ABS1UX23_9PROT|nr:flagellar hook capping FlgD N-terminal domain-containing protein [Belnapia mucosa]MBL6454018.1 flagellar hook assembly protein FlgD [Belnapia mucosa]
MTTTSATTASAAPAAASAAKPGGIAGDFNTFLTLLTTQLKNQDPTKAMDTNEMTNQLVSFASVEQQIAVNSNLTKLIALQQGAQLTAAAPLIGQQVEVESDQLSLQDGAAALRLPAAGAARQAVVRVLDSANRILRQETVTLGPKAQDWRWDGRSGSGVRQADGAYRFTIAGRDAAGVDQPLAATVLATATAAQRPAGGDIQLSLGALSVGFDAVRGLAGR